MIRHIKTFIIFLSILRTVQAQNPLNATFKTGPENEEYKDYFPNGKIRTSYTVKNRNLEGVYSVYFKSGKVKQICNFDHGHFHGSNKNFNSSGQILEEEMYQHDTLLYYKVCTYYKDGTLKSQESMTFDKDSLKINPFIKSKEKLNYVEYNRDLSLKAMKSHGQYSEYFKSGKIKMEYLTVNREMNGIYKEYFENGILAIESGYRNDELEGVYKEFDKSGRLSGEFHYHEGKLEGSHKNYFSNGKLSSESNYHNGKLEGDMILYSETGQVVSRGTWHEGKLVDCHCK